MLEAGSKSATQTLKASNVNHAIFINSNARASVCDVCVCLQVDCQLIDTAPEHDDNDMGRGAAMDSMDDKEVIAGTVVPCCPICVVVDGALAAQILSHSRRALAHTIVNRRSVMYR